MKLALVSDIHGNLEALDAVLAELDRTVPGARLVCGGDIVGYGPDPEACIARLRDRGAVCVIGNHEEMVLGRRDFSHCVHAGIVAAVWTRTALSSAAREYLERLPPWVEAAPGVIVCHGNLESSETYVSTPERAEAAMTQLRARHPGARVLVCGHTHHQAVHQEDGGFQLVTAPREQELRWPCLVNPGSVGQARDSTKPMARYAVLDIEGRRISFHELTYDPASTLRKLRQAGLVAKVTLPPPKGWRRWVERWKTRWARYRASSR